MFSNVNLQVAVAYIGAFVFTGVLMSMLTAI